MAEEVSCKVGSWDWNTGPCDAWRGPGRPSLVSGPERMQGQRWHLRSHGQKKETGLLGDPHRLPHESSLLALVLCGYLALFCSM